MTNVRSEYDYNREINILKKTALRLSLAQA